MPEQDTSDFTVVDRRRAAQESAPESDEAPDAAEPETQRSEPPNEAPQPSPAETPPASSEPEDQELPDPTMLITLAAMHLPTRELMTTLLGVFDRHAWRGMGLVPDHTGEVHKDLPSAQLAIDCLAFLLGKVENALDESDRRDIQRRLADLRMNYVAKLREP